MTLQHNKNDKTDMRVLHKDGHVLGYIKEYVQHGEVLFRASVTNNGMINSGILNTLQDAIGYIVSEKGLMSFTDWCKTIEENKK
jgi:hypothetical protein